MVHAFALTGREWIPLFYPRRCLGLCAIGLSARFTKIQNLSCNFRQMESYLANLDDGIPQLCFLLLCERHILLKFGGKSTEKTGENKKD